MKQDNNHCIVIHNKGKYLGKWAETLKSTAGGLRTRWEQMPVSTSRCKHTTKAATVETKCVILCKLWIKACHSLFYSFTNTSVSDCTSSCLGSRPHPFHTYFFCDVSGDRDPPEVTAGVTGQDDTTWNEDKAPWGQSWQSLSVLARWRRWRAATCFSLAAVLLAPSASIHVWQPCEALLWRSGATLDVRNITLSI